MKKQEGTSLTHFAIPEKRLGLPDPLLQVLEPRHEVVPAGRFRTGCAATAQHIVSLWKPALSLFLYQSWLARLHVLTLQDRTIASD